MSGKPTKAERTRRVDVVHRLLLLGLRRTQIIEQIERKYPQWGVRPRTIDDYIAAATKQLIADGEADRQLERGRALDRLHDLWTRCLQAGEHRDALAVQDQINKLFGLYQPIEVNLHDARRELVDMLVEEVLREAEDVTAGSAGAD